MKLNIGCTSLKPGSRYRNPEWVNLDLHAHAPGIMRGDMRRLPFKEGAFEEVHIVHTLEHVNRHEHLPVLQEIFRVLTPGGLAYVEVPDWQQTVRLAHEAFERNDMKMVHQWHTSMYGKQRFVGDYHLAGFYPFKLCELLRNAGFGDVAQFVDKEDMISNHYRVEGVILMRGTKPGMRFAV